VAGSEDLEPRQQASAPARHFRLQAVAREPRVAAISRVEEAVRRHGGFILDFKAFSDLSLNLLVESSGSGVLGIADSLLALGWPVDVEPGREALDACASGRLEGSVQLTFPEGDGTLAHPQPAVPG
jgi:hypothetical protein